MPKKVSLSPSQSSHFEMESHIPSPRDLEVRELLSILKQLRSGANQAPSSRSSSLVGLLGSNSPKRVAEKLSFHDREALIYEGRELLNGHFQPPKNWKR